jgi:hypothetical protein
MVQTSKPLWNLARFIQTLSYFEAVPALSWVQKIFGSAARAPQLQAGFIFDFRTDSALLSQMWGALDDVVMGGISSSTFQHGAEGALFTGIVSTSNAGGFVSVRTRNFEPPLDLAQYLGLELRVKGDGKRYKFLIRDEDAWDSVAYAYSFDTMPGVWKNVRVPFAELVPVFRAKTLKNERLLNAAHIRSLQLMLSKFEYDGVLNPRFAAGSFSLLVESIGVY